MRISKENLGSEPLGPWYGGTGAIRLRQVVDGWLWAYTLDDRASRGTSGLPEAEFRRVLEHIPGARLRRPIVRSSLDVDVPEDALAALKARVAPLRTRLARLGRGAVALFGDLQVERAAGASSGLFQVERAAGVSSGLFQVERAAGVSSGLFHLGGNRFNAFRTGSRWSALDPQGMAPIAARLPSARLRREGDMSVVEVGDADLALLLRMAGET